MLLVKCAHIHSWKFSLTYTHENIHILYWKPQTCMWKCFTHTVCVWGFPYSMWMVSCVCERKSAFQLCIWHIHLTSMCESISLKTEGVSVETEGGWKKKALNSVHWRRRGYSRRRLQNNLHAPEWFYLFFINEDTRMQELVHVWV